MDEKYIWQYFKNDSYLKMQEQSDELQEYPIQDISQIVKITIDYINLFNI